MNDKYEMFFRILLIIGVWVIGLFFWSLIVMWIWNCVITTVFGLPVVSYWQSMGIYALCSILFKSTFNVEKQK